MVVLNPRWLCNATIGRLLSHEHLEQVRVTGCYTVDDFQLLFPDMDALDLLQVGKTNTDISISEIWTAKHHKPFIVYFYNFQVLESLNLCTQCDNDGDIEYEFPCFNFVETLPGLCDQHENYHDAVYGGVKVQTPKGTCNLLDSLFLRLQAWKIFLNLWKILKNNSRKLLKFC